jgi:hypothetical protein
MRDLVPPAKKRRGSPSESPLPVEQSTSTSDKDGSNDTPSEPDGEAELSPGQRVSAYVQVFEEILTIVLEYESSLFTSRELAALHRWKALDCTAPSTN